MNRTWLTFGVVAAATALAVLGQRLSPPQRGPTGAESRDGCRIEALEALRSAASQWCANGLFTRVSVTGDDEHVIAVAQFSPNGSQVWQIQSTNLLATFRGLTDRMAADARGRNVSISVHDAADRRVGACARLSTDATAACELK